MKISKIKDFPSSLCVSSSHNYHESLFRSYQILEKVKVLLELETPPQVILEIIDEIESCVEKGKSYK